MSVKILWGWHDFKLMLMYLDMSLDCRKVRTYIKIAVNLYTTAFICANICDHVITVCVIAIQMHKKAGLRLCCQLQFTPPWHLSVLQCNISLVKFLLQLLELGSVPSSLWEVTAILVEKCWPGHLDLCICHPQPHRNTPGNIRVKVMSMGTMFAHTENSSVASKQEWLTKAVTPAHVAERLLDLAITSASCYMNTWNRMSP